MMKIRTKGNNILKRSAAVFAIFALIVLNLTPLLIANADTNTGTTRQYHYATDVTGTWLIGHNSNYAIIYGITEEGLNKLTNQEAVTAGALEANAAEELTVKAASSEQSNSVKVVVPSAVTAKNGTSYTVGAIAWEAFSADRYDYCSVITDFEFPSTLNDIYEETLIGTAFFNDPSNWTKDGCLYVGTADNPYEYLMYGTAMNTVNDEATEYGGMTKDKIADSGMDASNIVVKKEARLMACYAFVPIALIPEDKRDEEKQYSRHAIYNDLENRTLESVSFESGSQLERTSESAFRSCQSLKSATLPDGMTKVSAFTFDECEYLKEVYIPESVTIIGESAFSYCKRLKLVLPDTESLTIARAAFYNACMQFRFTIPDKMTVLKSGTFDGLGIMNITIPATVTEIQQDAFYSWLPSTTRYSPTINFNTVTYGGSAKQWDAIGGSALTFRKITYGSADVTASGDKYTLNCDPANVTQYGIIVKKGDSFSFSVALNKGYSKGDDFSVSVNGSEISGSKMTPSWSNSEEMVYTVTNVQEDQVISVTGIAKKESADKTSSSGSSSGSSSNSSSSGSSTNSSSGSSSTGSTESSSEDSLGVKSYAAETAKETLQASESAETAEPEQEISAQETESEKSGVPAAVKVAAGSAGAAAAIGAAVYIAKKLAA